MQPEVCRRKTDRRQTNQPFHFYSVIGRRRQARRQKNATQAAAIDHHPPIYLLITVSVLALCFADAFNTLMLLQHGAKELNPFMDLLIRHDTQLFIAAKFALTSLGLLILVGYRDSIFIRCFKTRHLLYGVFFMYTSLILYQSLLVPDYMFGLVFPL